MCLLLRDSVALTGGWGGLHRFQVNPWVGSLVPSDGGPVASFLAVIFKLQPRGEVPCGGAGYRRDPH